MSLRLAVCLHTTLRTGSEETKFLFDSYRKLTHPLTDPQPMKEILMKTDAYKNKAVGVSLCEVESDTIN